MRLALAVLLAFALAALGLSSCGPAPCVTQQQVCGDAGCDATVNNICDGGK